MKLACCAIAMTLCILDAKTVLQGATNGIELCMRSVIPALFPLLTCSTYLTGNLGIFSSSLLRPVGKLCRIPSSCVGILITGFLGGYPTGAQAVAQAYESGSISKETASRMLGFCNNAGPAFIFGMLSAYFSDIRLLFLLWVIHITSAIFVGILLPGPSDVNAKIPAKCSYTLPQALSRSVKVMALICGWVILFRVFIQFLEKWILWALPNTTNILIIGLLELTNGCVRLCDMTDEPARFMLVSVFLSAGGVCVGMQTCSVTGDLGTGMYFPGKSVQCCISLLICSVILPFLYPGADFLWPVLAAATVLLFLMYCLHFRKNNSSNFQLHRV